MRNSEGYPGSINHNMVDLIDQIVKEIAPAKIAIRDSIGQAHGYMLPITVSTTQDTAIITKMTFWRNRARRAFMTQFTATNERTTDWLNNILLKDDARLLFLIYTDSSELVGQYGFKNLDTHSAELDNLIRGESGGFPQLIRYVEIALVNWLFQTFHVEEVVAYVLSNNVLPLQLHYSVGFQEAGRLPLRKVTVGDEKHLSVLENPDAPSPDNLYQIRAAVTRDNFYTAIKGHPV